MVVEMRRWTTEQLDRIMDIWLCANRQAHPFVDAAYWERNRDEVRAALPQANVLVWMEGEDIAGFLGRNGDWIEGLFVDETRRSQGIGHALLEAAKQGRSRLGLAVYARNGRAVRFYQREGFCLVKRQEDAATGQTVYARNGRAVRFYQREGFCLVKRQEDAATGQTELILEWTADPSH